MALADPQRRFWLGAGLLALSLAVFVPILGHEWLNYDDDVYITANPDLLQGLGWDGLVWAFSTFHGANWFPLTWLSWLLDYELWGLSPTGFHATNLALHAAGTLLLFGALTRLTGCPARSAFVAAVFAVHPLHVEAVAWAAVRKDPLSAVFFFCALWVWARAGDRQPSARDVAVVALLLALGLMAKPVLVTLPAVLLLLDAWPLGRLRRQDDPERWDAERVRSAVLEKIPLVAVVAVIGAVAFIAQQQGGTVAALRQISFPVRVGNALVSYRAYLGPAFWPGDLAIFYPHPGEALPGWKVAGSATILAALTAAALSQTRRRPYLAMGWLWYLGMLVPMIGLVQVGSQARADRYTYLPLIGITICVAWGVPDLLRSWRHRQRALFALGMASVIALALVAMVQVRYWRDSASLFEHALRVTTRNPIAHAHLGSALLERGRADETVAHYRKALEIEPGFVRVANNLAWLLATHSEPSLRNPALAVQLARRATEGSDQPDPAILDTLAAAQAAAGRYDAAIRTAEDAQRRAESAGQVSLAAQIRARLGLYRARLPYRESVSPPSP